MSAFVSDAWEEGCRGAADVEKSGETAARTAIAQKVMIDLIHTAP
jgi:hypothetical protein